MVETKGPTGPPHGPAPSLWPLGFAVGLTVVLVGLVIGSWSAAAVGAVLMVAFGFIWVRDVLTGGEAEAPTARAAVVVPDVVEEEEPEQYGRGAFLGLTTLGLGGVITGLVALPVAGFAVLPAFVGQGTDDIDIGPVDDYPEGEFVVATFLSDPEQGEVSRRTAYVRNNGAKDGLPSFTILSNRCVHLGCPVQASGPRNDEERKAVKTDQADLTLTPVLPANFSCPCHGGAYDTEGNRLSGPPVRAMDRYKFAIVDGNLHLLEPYSVGSVEGTGGTATIVAYGIQGPGEHVDGLSGWLYPIPPQDLR